MLRKNFEGRKQQRKESAVERTKARSSRTHQAQLMLLDRKFGEGKGAIKERLRLHNLIQEEQQQKKQEKKTFLQK